MSSFEDVRAHRAEFRDDAQLSGASFAFVAKLDMNERWKIKAHFGMLDRARPHAPVLEAYRAQLASSLRTASDGLLRIAADLDIGDYAYLQSQALMNDGHPLGDYVSWLLSSHLTTLAFETAPIRGSQRAVDKLEFEKKTFASTEPSPVVAQLFHSALLSSNLGPLGPHPRAKPGTAYEAFPRVQLGDVFLDSHGQRPLSYSAPIATSRFPARRAATECRNAGHPRAGRTKVAHVQDRPSSTRTYRGYAGRRSGLPHRLELRGI